jgi:hypothetical protein
VASIAWPAALVLMPASQRAQQRGTMSGA